MSYDVAVLGGGLAGLTLGLQLKRERPETTVLVAEKRSGPAPLAAFKVGESTVDVSAHYFGEVLGLGDHLEAEHVYKAGLRFFFSSGDNSDIARRVELGPADIPLPVPSYQLDRGLFENELADCNRAAGVELIDGCFVKDVELGDEEHVVHLACGSQERTVTARWVVDATGRASLLKRKLGLAKDVSHTVNSSWLRLAGGLDIEGWSDDAGWLGRMARGGIRRQSTTHLMGEGYWVWLIPLGTGPISIGIVADPRFHPMERMNTLDAAIDWLGEHEPQLGAAIDARRDDVEDFLKVEDFAFSAERVISPARWALTGEAGAFADPLYSPGSDFIAYANTYITDLVVRDLAGEDVAGRAEGFNSVFLIAFDAVLKTYADHYATMGNPQVMAAKVAWDHEWYWSVNALRFMSGELCDLEGMAAIGPPLLRAVELTARMQTFFMEWNDVDRGQASDAFVDLTTFALPFHRDLATAAELDRDAFVAQLARDVEMLEGMAVVLFHKAAERAGLPVDAGSRVDPYALTLDRDRWEPDGLFKDSGLTLEEAEGRTGDLSGLWLDEQRRAPAQAVTR